MKNILSILILSTLCLSGQSLKVGSSVEKLNSFKYETPNSRELKVPKKDQKATVLKYENQKLKNISYIYTKQQLRDVV